ncbi:hypothetical protein HDV57DRAFT_503812 [Trichoderma longibrachiatum]
MHYPLLAPYRIPPRVGLLACLARILPAWAMGRGPGKSTDCSCSSNNIALITSLLAADFGIATLLDACWRTEIQWKMETAKCL